MIGPRDYEAENTMFGQWEDEMERERAMPMLERVARAICKEIGVDFDGEFECRKEFALHVARAAIEAMREPHTLEMQMAGAEAIALYNIETDGPAKPHDECKTPDDWMGRGANIAGRMVSGEEASRAFNAMLDSILSEQEAGK